MGALRVILAAGGMLIAFALIVGAFVGISSLVLWATGRLLPLAGRRRRR
jgi:hypothetical protein